MVNFVKNLRGTVEGDGIFQKIYEVKYYADEIFHEFIDIITSY